MKKNGKITKKQMAKNAFFSGKNFWNLNKLNLTADIVGAALAVTGASSILIPAALATAIIGGSVTAILHSLYKDNKENKRTKKEETTEDIVKADKEITKKNVNDCFETLEKLIFNFNKKEKINTKEKQILTKLKGMKDFYEENGIFTYGQAKAIYNIANTSHFKK